MFEERARLELGRISQGVGDNSESAVRCMALAIEANRLASEAMLDVAALRASGEAEEAQAKQDQADRLRAVANDAAELASRLTGLTHGAIGFTQESRAEAYPHWDTTPEGKPWRPSEVER